MTTRAGTDEAAADAWRSVRDDPDIQFAPVQLPATPREPGIIERILDYLGELFAPAAGALVANWSIIWPLLAGAGALLRRNAAGNRRAVDVHVEGRHENREPHMVIPLVDREHRAVSGADYALTDGAHRVAVEPEQPTAQ